MAQTLKFGNKTWATKVGSTLAYNDENENYKPLPFAFTRSTSATRVNKEGLIEVVTNDRPRIDYTDTSDGVLLLEKAATNLQTYSSDLASVYVPTNITQTSNYGISPDGSLTSTRVVLSNLTDSRSVETLTGVLTNNTVYTFSCYYKGVKGESAYMYFLSSTGGTNISKEIIFTGKWQRESITFTAGSASNYTYIVDVRQGVSTATDFEVWGGQVEAGNVASSYIPTQGSATTRVAETANGAGNSEVFSDSQGVLFADISAFDGAGGGTRRIEVSNGVNATQYVRLQIANGDGSLYAILNNGSQQFLFNETSFNATLPNKISLKYKQNDFSLFLNGFEVGSSNVGNTFANGVLTQVNFSSTASEFYGKTKEIGYYDEILTDLELETLTSYRSWESMVNELNLNIIYNG